MAYNQRLCSDLSLDFRRIPHFDADIKHKKRKYCLAGRTYSLPQGEMATIIISEGFWF